MSELPFAASCPAPLDKSGGAWTRGLRTTATLVFCMLAFFASAADAQSDAGDDAVTAFVAADEAVTRLASDEAARLLAQTLPEAPDARYDALRRHYRAAQVLDDRERLIELARQLVDAGRGRADGEAWIPTYLNAEFQWGSQGKALAACEPFLADRQLSLTTRALVALRQTYFAALGHDRALLFRLWPRADELAEKAIRESAGKATSRLVVSRLQVRSEIERWQGDAAASVATLREAVVYAQSELRAARARSRASSDPAVRDALGWLDGSLGMLTYALVRHGRAQEAIAIAQANLALWRAGELADGLGARWNYRLATSLNATQQYEAALAAARLSDEMLQRAGAGAASHTRWMARQEIVRGLIGLRRWQEADQSYREFLAALPPDVLARTRASDWRLLALLGAKNGRLDEALEQAERSHRYRVRLYGAHHPQTQEAAGVRGVVRLLRGEVKPAMSDYEELFAATLDSPGGWLDLDLRGVRGYVFGIAFDEFLRHVAEQALRGERVDPALSNRALQLADRSNLGVTQRALADSTARVLAATPALRALVEEEQAQRQTTAALFARLGGTLSEDDRLRREARSDAFQALPEDERKAHKERAQAVRAQIKAQQAEAASARASLDKQRQTIAGEFPGYADLITPATPTAEQLRRLLGPGEALLFVHPTETATLVWLVGADGRSGFAASKLTRTDLTRRVTELRAMLDLASAPPGREPALQPASLYALYRDLLAPFERDLRDLRSLIVATQGPLASLPLAALVTHAPAGDAPPAWLVRQVAITQIPSPSALQALRRVAQPAAATKAMIGFGDPLFKLATAAQADRSPGGPAARQRPAGAAPAATATRYDAERGFRYGDMPPLPETRGELLAVAAALGADPQTDLLFGSRATRRAVIEAKLLDRRVVAFATHGLMPGDLPGISKPALAMAVTADARESPLLELDDVLGLRLNAQWVLLSACNTAAGEPGGGAMSGLVRGFFFAGARSVLATHWAVDSESAAALSAATFQTQAGASVSRSESLRQAQLALIDGKLGGGRWRHPFHWAPYALFGDPER